MRFSLEIFGRAAKGARPLALICEGFIPELRRGARLNQVWAPLGACVNRARAPLGARANNVGRPVKIGWKS